MTPVITALLKEIGLALFRKISIKILAERFATRLVLYGLNKLQSQATNEVAKETVTDIISQLKGKKLKIIDGLGD